MKSILLALPVILGLPAPPAPAVIQFFQATPPAARPGEPVTLRWSASGTDQVRLDPLDQSLPAQGQMTVTVTGRCIYWLHVSNLQGGQSVPLVVEVLPGPAPALRPPPSPYSGPTPAMSAVPGKAWIQFAALHDPRNVTRLSRQLARLPGLRVTVSELGGPTRKGKKTLRLRTGPFPSLQAARKRLRELKPRLRTLRIHPFVSS